MTRKGELRRVRDQAIADARHLWSEYRAADRAARWFWADRDDWAGVAHLQLARVGALRCDNQRLAADRHRLAADNRLLRRIRLQLSAENRRLREQRDALAEENERLVALNAERPNLTVVPRPRQRRAPAKKAVGQ